jgi:hypothetical protein
MNDPTAGLDGPSRPVRVEPIKLPDVQPSQPEPDRAPAAPEREPEKVPA